MKLDLSQHIDITGADLVETVKAVYDLSKPIGKGLLQYTPEPLSDEEASSLIHEPDYMNLVVSLDYVKGRSCKFHVWQLDNRLYIRKDWRDHVETHMQQLLNRIGITIEE